MSILSQIGFQFVEARCPICSHTHGYLEVFRRDCSRNVKGKTEYYSTFFAQVSCAREECYVYENNKCSKSKDKTKAVDAANDALLRYDEWARELDDAVAGKETCKVLQFPGSRPVQEERKPVQLIYHELKE